MMKKIVLALVMIVAVMGATLPAARASDAYPSYPIQLVIPFSAGGEFDEIGRLIAQHLSGVIGQSVVVLNKPGAGGMVGGAFVAKAKPDGYTLLLGGPGTLAIDPNLYAQPLYDPVKDFSPIIYVGGTAYFLVVRPDLAHDLKTLIAKAKAAPGKLTFASPGVGSNLSLTMELFKIKTGTQIEQVPYPGVAPALIDMLAGRVQMGFAPEVVLPYIRSGKLIALAASTPQRSVLLPNVPTLQEEGVSGADSSGWYGISGPPGLPANIVKKLNVALNKVLASPQFRKQAAALGLSVKGGAPEVMAEQVKTESAKWKQVIKATGIKPQ